ncbi:hypothetical protein KOW79_019033 [Hemibagrus wyckioides]|uniref:Uncharacterized protein n=1 Tax=Hemibagrus wyckioides TaxID=337641 RepID=A0A9D3NAX9_9TELE|nr:hypothetical protein KOW79_019033 [Hemibagrus wyckioides]
MGKKAQASGTKIKDTAWGQGAVAGQPAPQPTSVTLLTLNPFNKDNKGKGTASGTWNVALTALHYSDYATLAVEEIRLRLQLDGLKEIFVPWLTFKARPDVPALLKTKPSGDTSELERL